MGKSHDDIRQEVLKKIKFGQSITIRESEQETEPIRARVVAFYPEYVLCHRESHNIKDVDSRPTQVCFRYYEFWKRLQTREIKVVIPGRLKGVRG